MEYLNSSSVNRLLLEILTPDDSKIYLPEVGVDLWDFSKSQIESKTQTLDYVDLLKGIECLHKIVSTGSKPTTEDIENMKPLLMRFLESVSLLAIKLHIIKNMKVEASMPSVFYHYSNKTSSNKLDSSKINLVDSVPYVDNLYTYMDILKDNDIPLNLIKDQDLGHIDYTYLSMYLFIYNCTKEETIVLRRDIEDAYI